MTRLTYARVHADYRPVDYKITKYGCNLASNVVLAGEANNIHSLNNESHFASYKPQLDIA